MNRIVGGILIFLLMISSVLATTGPGLDINGSCYTNTPGVTIYFSNESMNIVNLGIENSCASGTSVQWTDPVDISVLGPVLQDEVIIAPTFVYVDTAARPDLDKPATLVFRSIPFAVEPEVLKDGSSCNTGCNVSFDSMTRDLTVDVAGFSNYSLTSRRDFLVYSDQQPELKAKVYQTIDLGDSLRNEEFSCIIQIYGVDVNGNYVLVQTNPQRQVQARMFGSPDQNQPESLGYFPTKNGVANVYWDGGAVAGYNDFEYVAMCSSNSTKLIYEEPISTRYSPVGRSMVGRGIWLTDGSNALFIILGIVLVVIGGLLIAKFIRTVR
jgi:hypothetical protein